MGATFPAMIAGAARRRPLRRTRAAPAISTASTRWARPSGASPPDTTCCSNSACASRCGALSGSTLLAAACALLANLAPRVGLRARRRRTSTDSGAADTAPFDADAARRRVSLRGHLRHRLRRPGLRGAAHPAQHPVPGQQRVQCFPLVLTAFLLGTGISAVGGTWLYGLVLRRTGEGDRLFGITALAAGRAGLRHAVSRCCTTRVIGAEQFARFADAARRNPAADPRDHHRADHPDRRAAAGRHPHAAAPARAATATSGRGHPVHAEHRSAACWAPPSPTTCSCRASGPGHAHGAAPAVCAGRSGSMRAAAGPPAGLRRVGAAAPLCADARARAALPGMMALYAGRSPSPRWPNGGGQAGARGARGHGDRDRPGGSRDWARTATCTSMAWRRPRPATGTRSCSSCWACCRWRCTQPTGRRTRW